MSLSSLNEPELTTAHVAKKIILDLNDPHLLIDALYEDGASLRTRRSLQHRRSGYGAFAKGLSQRYNISNDEAYDQLKENHQNKIRGMLGNPSIKHSLPALRLQWPFVSPEALSFSRSMFLRSLTF